MRGVTIAADRRTTHKVSISRACGVFLGDVPIRVHCERDQIAMGAGRLTHHLTFSGCAIEDAYVGNPTHRRTILCARGAYHILFGASTLARQLHRMCIRR